MPGNEIKPKKGCDIGSAVSSCEKLLYSLEPTRNTAIVEALSNNKGGFYFNDLMGYVSNLLLTEYNMPSGISKISLHERLKKLMQEGIVKRKKTHDKKGKSRYKYRLDYDFDIFLDGLGDLSKVYEEYQEARCLKS